MHHCFYYLLLIGTKLLSVPILAYHSLPLLNNHRTKEDEIEKKKNVLLSVKKYVENFVFVFFEKPVEVSLSHLEPLHSRYLQWVYLNYIAEKSFKEQERNAMVSRGLGPVSI